MHQIVKYRGCVRIFDKISPKAAVVFGDEYQIGNGEITHPDALLIRSSQIDVEKYPKLRAVGRAGIGVENINVARATHLGIAVFNTPGGNAPAVSELLFTMLAADARNVLHAMTMVKSAEAKDEEELKKKLKEIKKELISYRLYGKTLGIVGFGHIGKEVAKEAIERGMRVVAYDPYIGSSGMRHPRLHLVKDLLKTCAQADILTVHVPLTEETRGLIGSEQLAHMNSSGILANLARGEIVDDAAAIEALDTGHLNTYISDFPTQTLRSHPKVFCVPHLGASTEEAEDTCAIMAATQVKDYLEFGMVINSVNLPRVVLDLDDATVMRLAIINRDVPDMIGQISSILGRYGYNIHRFANESNGVVGYNLIDLEVDLPSTVTAEIKKLHGIIPSSVRELRFPK